MDDLAKTKYADGELTIHVISDREAGEPTKYDKMITDILKHLTTLDTGLLAIIAAFNQEIMHAFNLNSTLTMCFLLSFFLSLALCMCAFGVTIIILRQKDAGKWIPFYRMRELMIGVAAIGYVASLTFLFALFMYAYQMPPSAK